MLRYEEKKTMFKVRGTVLVEFEKLQKKVNKQFQNFDPNRLSKDEREQELRFVRSRMDELEKIIRRNLEL